MSRISSDVHTGTNSVIQREDPNAFDTQIEGT